MPGALHAAPWPFQGVFSLTAGELKIRVTQTCLMIALLHGALGATCGVLTRRRAPAVAVALVSHLAVDAINHDEPTDAGGHLRLDLVALDGLLLGLAWLALSRRRGVFSAESVGAVAACLPDLEHLLPRAWVRGRSGRHEPFAHARWPSRKLNIWSQFAVAAVAWGALLGCGRRGRQKAASP